VTGTSGALIARLRAGEISAAFVSGDVKEPGFIADPAFVEELVLITHRSIRRPPRPADLREKTLVAFSAGCTYRARVETWLATEGIRPPRTFEVASYHAMLACIAANVGYAFAPRSVLRASSARTAVVAHRPSQPPWRMTTWLVRRANDRSRAVEALAELVRREARRQGSDGWGEDGPRGSGANSARNMGREPSASYRGRP
jgi:DNA-binding transcriptional LysR family regulator